MLSEIFWLFPQQIFFKLFFRLILIFFGVSIFISAFFTLTFDLFNTIFSSFNNILSLFFSFLANNFPDPDLLTLLIMPLLWHMLLNNSLNPKIILWPIKKNVPLLQNVPFKCWKNRVVKTFCDTELLERQTKKNHKIQKFHPSIFERKTNGSLHHFLDGYHIQYPCRLRVNKCLIFNFAFLFDFFYRFWQWGSWRKWRILPLLKACVPIFCQVYFSLLAPRAIYFVSPWTFLLFLRNNKCYVLLVCDFT